MAYQHFYSRVPSRVSLYNKIDGFDTFAHSVGIDREFILGELSAVYTGLLGLHNPIKIRRGEIPVVYTQAALSSGRLVHSSVKYLPTDFTGERSAYFTHSLILNDDEREAAFRRVDTDVFNRDMFITDISLFNLTSRGVTSNPACAERAYIPRPLSDARAAISPYHPDMMKSFIYSLLLALCEGGREVYFRLPVPDAALSDAAVDFFNALMTVIPYSLRERMSFASFVSSEAAYPGFQLKCASSGLATVNTERAVLYDFAGGSVTGMTAENERGVMLSGFIYSLFAQPKIREAFLEFVRGIEEKHPDLTLDIKALKELTFLFWGCSGFYVESSVLPDDDAICRLLDIYEKYGAGLTTRHRVQIYKCLGRYSDGQIAIPDSVFSRVSRLYPTDCVEAKAVALEVMLNLIHVDLMRDSLFCFITRNYMRETAEVKAEIISNLSRVFYGGFLQSNILAFFDLYFRREPVHTRDIILDKLLLSIRTPEIQGQIIVFLDRHYAVFTREQKLKVCNTILEMMPECDGLSALMVSLLNRRIGCEEVDILRIMRTKLSEILAATLAAGDGRLAAMFIENEGFCEEIALAHAINQLPGSEIILGILAAMPGATRADKLIRAYAIAEGINRGLYPAFIYRLAGGVVAVWPSTLSEMLKVDAVAEKELPADMLEPFRQIAIYPAVIFTLHQAFSSEGGVYGVEAAITYANKNPYIASTAEYRVIVDYLEICRRCDLGDVEDAFKLAIGLPAVPELRQSIAAYMRANAYKPDSQDAETMAAYELMMDYLSTGSVALGECYARYLKYFEDIHTEEGRMSSKAVAKHAAADSVELLISSASEIANAHDSLAAIVMSDESGLRSAIREFIESYGIGSGNFLKKQVRDAHFEIEELATELIEERNDAISTPRDAVNFLFGIK